MHPLLNIAVRAARKGGNLIIKYFDFKQSIDINQKKEKLIINNIKTNAEKIIQNIIRKAYPHHSIVILNDFKKKIPYFNNFLWIIKLINGNNNFLNKFPHFCVSISFQKKNKQEISVVYDPLKNDLFTAISGKGAQMNGYRMRCNKKNKIKKSNGLIFFSKKKKNILKKTESILFHQTNIKITGCYTLDLLYVAAGITDFSYSTNFYSFYSNAAFLHIKESGGSIIAIKQKDIEKKKKKYAFLAGHPSFLEKFTSIL